MAATAVLPITIAVPDTGSVMSSGVSSTVGAPLPVVAANVGHPVVPTAPERAGKSTGTVDTPALTGSRWEAPGAFDQRGIRIMRSASPYGPSRLGRLQVRGEMTPRKTAAQEAVEHLAKRMRNIVV